MRRVLCFDVLILFLLVSSGQGAFSAALEAKREVVPEYSGEVRWGAETGGLTFVTSGTMPSGKESFFYNVPSEVKKIFIAKNVTVKGGLRVGYRDKNNPLHIVGEDRKTSVIFGTDALKWTENNKVPENSKWTYGSVSVLADATVYVSNLTAKNPRGYNISGYANRSVIHVSKCDLLDTRPGDNNNSDGFAGSSGSSIRDSFISTSDDGIKVYSDITIENVTIEQHRNGAPIQFGWGGNSSMATATIRNLKIKGVDPESLYNMAPFTWEGGNKCKRDIRIDGLSVDIKGKVYHEQNDVWLPIGLFELKPENCTLNMQIKNAKVGGVVYGLLRTQGVVNMDGIVIR